MNRAHRIRLNPTAEQSAYFARAAGCARFAFNWMLAEWRTQYEAGGKPSAMGLAKDLRAVKAERFPWLLDVTKCVVDGARIDIGSAFANFFRNCKKSKGRKVGYPNFKSKRRSKPAFYLANTHFRVDGHSVYIPKLGLVNMTESLRFAGKILSGRISFKAGYWWLVVSVELPDIQCAHPRPAVGVDLGLKELAVCSDGTRYPNLRHQRGSERTVKGLQRSLARKVKGSSNWLKTKARLGRAEYRVACRRADAIHKMTTGLVRKYSLIGIEDLAVRSMVRLHSLARAISDAAWGEIRRQLEYKAGPAGSVVQVVDRWYPSSRLCSTCGWKNETLTLADRVWTCQCGVVHDRDLNAARNIESEALRLHGLRPGTS